MESEIILEQMLGIANSFANSREYESALECYNTLIKAAYQDVKYSKAARECCAQAYYQLGVFYAQGYAVSKDFLLAAESFQKAEDLGDSDAHKLLLKSTLDYFNDNIETIQPSELYNRVVVYCDKIYSDKREMPKVFKTFLSIAQLHLSKHSYVIAAKYLRVLAEYGKNASAQNMLGVLYNSGTGVEKNDYVSMYWFHKAALQGIEAAKTDCDGIFGYYLNNFSRQQFAVTMDALINQCRRGSNDIPIDCEEAEYWEKRKQDAMTQWLNEGANGIFDLSIFKRKICRLWKHGNTHKK